MTISAIYQKFLSSSGISTDTRNIKPNSLFFALKGDNFNANAFAEEALDKGAKYVIVDEEEYYQKEDCYILVDDALQTLQELARYHRNQLAVPILALTGSNGKTTTKELLYAVLSQKYNTTATIGNLNNHIGVPLTLLSMTEQTEIGIIEMGANHFHEIELLCNIAEPNYGYITNFGKAHLEGFGSLKGVIKAKSELYSYLKNTNGLAFVNTKDQDQIHQTREQKRVLIGKDIKLLNTKDKIHVDWQGLKIKSNLIGTYNFQNIVAAIEIGAFFKVPKTDIKKGITSYIPTNKRSQIITKDSVSIILDAYNANPTSMIAALENFKKNTSKHKIVILGDMFELGESTIYEHREIAKLALTSGFEKVILIGEYFGALHLENAIQYKDFNEFKSVFNKKSFHNTKLLIKGSRGMALERIIDLFDS